MHAPLSTQSTAVRRQVVLFLTFLSSPECQAACARGLSPEQVAFELCRLWFDEIYTPGTRYMDGLKGDRSREDVAQFEACFTPEERAALERFHRFLELRLDMLPEDVRKREIFPQTDLWQSVIRDAGHVLEELGADTERLQQQLHWILRLALAAADGD